MLFFILLMLLSACSSLSPYSVANKITGVIKGENSSEIEVPKVEISSSQEEEKKLSWIFDLDIIGGSGSLKYTISNIRSISSIDELNKNGFLPGESSVFAYGKDVVDEYGNHSQTVYMYPEFISESGKFIEPITLLLMDVQIDSINANNGGRYDDPYIFSARNIASLLDPNRIYEGSPMRYDAKYYSDMNSCEESAWAFKLDPQESTSLQIGFLVGNNSDGTPVNMSGLYLGNGDMPLFELQMMGEIK